jgi:hypothetical protein
LVQLVAVLEEQVKILVQIIQEMLVDQVVVVEPTLDLVGQEVVSYIQDQDHLFLLMLDGVVMVELADLVLLVVQVVVVLLETDLTTTHLRTKQVAEVVLLFPLEV